MLPSHDCATSLANNLVEYFDNKIELIRSNLEESLNTSYQLPNAPKFLGVSFEQLSSKDTALDSFGKRRFAHATPHLWNTLPISIKCANSIDIFKKCSKTHFLKGNYFLWNKSSMKIYLDTLRNVFMNCTTKDVLCKTVLLRK